ERWPDRLADPIRVWVDSAGLGPSQSGFAPVVRDAFGVWSATGLPIRFRFVARRSDAEVRVQWADRLPNKTGTTTWRTTADGWMLSGDITLATHVSDGRPLDRVSIRMIALHEIGHLIGLSHSGDPGD